MKEFRVVYIFALVAVLSATAFLFSAGATVTAAQHGFILKEYEHFHDVLHPLEHEALPNNDFRRIRSESSLLVKRGRAIVKLGVPRGPSATREEFAKELKKFDKALARFKADTKTGSDAKLKASYSAVHDSFEMLASKLRNLYPLGMPPTISLDCPSSKPEAGSKVTFSANTGANAGVGFAWNLSVGRILTGQGTPTITIDTTGLAGQTIIVTVEVADGTLTANATCRVQIATNTTKDPSHPR